MATQSKVDDGYHARIEAGQAVVIDLTPDRTSEILQGFEDMDELLQEIRGAVAVLSCVAREYPDSIAPIDIAGLGALIQRNLEALTKRDDRTLGDLEFMLRNLLALSREKRRTADIKAGKDVS